MAFGVASSNSFEFLFQLSLSFMSAHFLANQHREEGNLPSITTILQHPARPETLIVGTRHGVIATWDIRQVWSFTPGPLPYPLILGFALVAQVSSRFDTGA